MPRADLMSLGLTETLVASAARTVTGASPAVGGWGAAKTVRAQLDVTAASGTSPTLDVTIQDTLDGTSWNTVGTFAQKVAAGREVINITTPFSETLRVSWAVSAGASFTFSVVAYTE